VVVGSSETLGELCLSILSFFFLSEGEDEERVAEEGIHVLFT
jgi:hypothetical protein